jgi:hypothetical protein
MKFIEQLGLSRDRSFKERADPIVIRLAIRDSVARENPVRIGINYENGVVSGIQQDGVSSFWPDAVHG